MIQRELITFASGAFRLVATLDLPEKLVFTAAGHEPPAHRVPAVIFCHGFTGNRIETRRMYARMGAALAARGIACFRFDHRGCGESTGDFLDFTPGALFEDLNAAMATFFGGKWFDPNRLAIVGYSLGGLSASYLLSRHPDFRTAVLIAPVARPEIIKDRLAQMPGFAGYEQRGWINYGGFRVSRDYLENIGEKAAPVEWAKTFPNPILFCHGGADEIVVPEQTDRFMAARSNPDDRKQIYEGVDHTFTDVEAMDQLIARAEEWLAGFLLV